MRPLGPAGDVLSQEDLIKTLGDPLNSVVKEDLDRPVETSRLIRVAQAERQYLYWQGKQYLTPKLDPASGVIGYKSAIDPAKTQGKRVFASVYNIIYGDGIKFVSVVGQRRPNQRCVPDVPDNEEQAKQAMRASAAVRYLHRQWGMVNRVKEMAFHLWVTGPVFLNTHFVSDGNKYGWDTEPVIDTVAQETPGGFRCQACGQVALGPFCESCGIGLRPEDYVPPQPVMVPTVVGTEQYPRGQVELDILSLLHVSTPFEARGIQDCDWLSYLTLRSKYKIMSAFGEKFDVDKVDGASGEDSSERESTNAQERVTNPDGALRSRDKNQWIVDLRWIRPEVYYALPDEYKAVAAKHFPDGLKLTRINGVVVQIDREKMDDYWSVCKTGTGEFINSDALCATTMPVQDDVNNFCNMAAETVLRAIPKTFVDGQLIDGADFNEKGAMVAEVIRTKLGTGSDLGKMIASLPTARFSDQLMPLLTGIREMGRDINGVRPELSGGGQMANTFREAMQRKNQALMQFNPPFAEIQDCISKASENGVRELARFGSGAVAVPPEQDNGLNRSEVVDVAMLQESGWHVEAEESVPMTFGEKAERMAQIVSENPQLSTMLGVDHPMNVEKVHQMFGVEDFYKPGANERAKVLNVIQRLLSEVSMQSIDPMTGMASEGPSVMPDEFEDKDHVFFADMVRAWCNSSVGERAREENPEGYRNVVLYGKQQEIMGQPPMPMPVPGAEPAPGAEQAAAVPQ